MDKLEQNMMVNEQKTRTRRQPISGEMSPNLTAYLTSSFEPAALAQLHLPLADEPFVETWRVYAAEATKLGAAATLARHLPQLSFPIRAGISETIRYRAVTRRGQQVEAESSSPWVWHDAAGITLHLQETLAGAIGVVSVADRRDFENLVQALIYKNEPQPIPGSMGACFVKGYNNWERVHQIQRDWQQGRLAWGKPTWKESFQALQQRKALFQDQFIILNRGPYSGVSAHKLGIEEQTWLNLSTTIRLYHELWHYHTQRIFRSAKNNIHDELIADFVGITAALGHFDAGWLLAFLGLEAYPLFRPVGRLANYRGVPPLSSSDFATVKHLVFEAVHQIHRLTAHLMPPPYSIGDLMLLALAMTQFSVAQLAERTGAEQIMARFCRLQEQGIIARGDLNKAPFMGAN